MHFQNNEEQLKKVARKLNDKAVIKAVESMPDSILPTCRIINDQDPKTGKKVKQRGHYDWVNLEKRKVQIAVAIEKLSESERLQVFKLFTGKLSGLVETAWQWLQHQPYQDGWSAKAFRSPHNTSMTRASRGDWMFGIIGLCSQYQVTEENVLEIASLLDYQAHSLVPILASQIDASSALGEQVLEHCVRVIMDDNSALEMSDYILSVLLKSSRPEGWDAVEKLLLAAQRQEGLRQSIVEKVDLAHPQAFVRMVKLILDENLLRFSSVARGIDVWFSQEWDARSVKAFRTILENSLGFLENEKAALEATKSNNAQEAYFGLWSLAFYDVEKALPEAQRLVESEDEEHRFIASYFLRQTSCGEAYEIATELLGDSNPTVVAHSLWALGIEKKDVDLTECLSSQLARVTQKSVAAPALVWPWTETKLKMSDLADAMLASRGKRSVLEVAEYRARMSPYGRRCLVHDVAKECKSKANTSHYQLLLEMAKDRSSDVVEAVFSALKKLKIDAEGSMVIEGLLTRKTANFRRSSLRLILQQSAKACFAACERLVAAKNAAQRLAGLELAGEIVSKKRLASEARSLVKHYSEKRPTLTKDEEAQIKLVLDDEKEMHTFTNALGLCDPQQVPLAEVPQISEIKKETKAAQGLIVSLHEWVEQRAEEEVEIVRYYSDSPEKVLFGSISYELPSYKNELSFEENRKKMPFGEELVEWFTEALTKYRDDDGLHLVRAVHLSKNLDDSLGYSWEKNGKIAKLNGVKLPRISLVYNLLFWLEGSATLGKEQVDLLLQYAEAECAYFSEKKLCESGFKKGKRKDLEEIKSPTWFSFLSDIELSDEQFEKFYTIQQWLWRPTIMVDGEAKQIDRLVRNDHLSLEVVLRAMDLELLDDNEVLFHLCGAAVEPHFGSYSSDFQSFVQLTGRKPLKGHAKYPAYPQLVSLAEKVKSRILEIEMTRGDLKMPTSRVALDIDYISGADYFMKFAEILGKANLVRQYQWGENTLAKNSVFSNLLRVSEPTEKDSVESFSLLAQQSGLPKSRFIELAMFAPQWVELIEGFLKYKGLAEAVWWVHAHTKDEHWEVSSEVREMWDAATAAKTPLASSDLVDGAVDVAWFQKFYSQLKKAKWEEVLKTAKFASSSGGHKRAELFANAMLKRVTKTELTKRIKEKRHQDSVRALGLLPLAGGKSREKDLLSRYELFKEFVRESKQFGSQRQASEKRCAQIGIENLARTAGYADPVRLEWAMEAKAVEDLKSGSVSLQQDDVEITLSIDAFGEPQVSVMRGDKALKAVPAKVKKVAAVKTFVARKTKLKKQLSRMRLSLEEMMCSREAFTGAELQTLYEHPLLKHFISQLVFSCEGALGYLTADGHALIDYNEVVAPVSKDDQVRIAHPHDFLEAQDWAKWQHHCFKSERVQPFKQVFREVYPISDAEKSDVKHRSARYAGHQVNPRQALALLGGRGWLTVPEEGVRKVFHKDEICAWVDFEEHFYTPAELEGLTIASVYFFKKNGSKLLPLDEVPSHIFSECMRDLDLVVSVAHMGGVDPEASQSTVEMRQALAQETCSMLGLSNVEFKETHILIQGSLAKYSIHLGSSLVKKTSGQSLFIVAVQSQHRGRIFLPSADSDPKTAELLSKIILLARDQQIKDPSILAQIKC